MLAVARSRMPHSVGAPAPLALTFCAVDASGEMRDGDWNEQVPPEAVNVT